MRRRVHMALLTEALQRHRRAHDHSARTDNIRASAARHPPAIRLERAIHDLFGLEALDAPDTRPWLDLGFWNVRHPLGKRGPARKPTPYEFLPAEGEGLHQIPVGPVHAGIIEPGHFRFTANGETCGAAGAAARLRAQGHRVPDARRHAR